MGLAAHSTMTYVVIRYVTNGRIPFVCLYVRTCVCMCCMKVCIIISSSSSNSSNIQTYTRMHTYIHTCWGF